MARDLSTTFHKIAHALESPEKSLVLLEITHSDMPKETIAAQDETDYNGAGSNGTFIGGDGVGGTAYVVNDTITLDDGSLITVDAIDGDDDVTQFTVTTVSTNPFNYPTVTVLAQTSTSGTGTEFELTVGDNNVNTTVIRVVQDFDDIVHNSDTFIAMGFGFAFPDEPESGDTRAQLAIDNIGSTLVDWLEVANWNNPTNVRIILVLRSVPNNVEWETTMGLHNIVMSQTKVVGTLSYDSFLGMPAVVVTYSPEVAPGLY